jgi:hypothetical protein
VKKISNDIPFYISFFNTYFRKRTKMPHYYLNENRLYIIGPINVTNVPNEICSIRIGLFTPLHMGCQNNTQSPLEYVYKAINRNVLSRNTNGTWIHPRVEINMLPDSYIGNREFTVALTYYESNGTTKTYSILKPVYLFNGPPTCSDCCC